MMIAAEPGLVGRADDGLLQALTSVGMEAELKPSVLTTGPRRRTLNRG